MSGLPSLPGVPHRWRGRRPDGPATRTDVLRRGVGGTGAAAPLQEVWIALRASERSILETVTLAHVADNQMPDLVVQLVANPSAWA